MSTSEYHVFTISNLPPDVIRTIIRLGQEDIDIMNQISPQWSALARAHLKIKTNLPVVNYFCWNTNDDAQTKLTIRIPERFRKYFNVEHWHIQTCFNNSSLIELDSDNLFISTVPFEMDINRIFDRSSQIVCFDIEVDIIRRNSEIEILKNFMTGQVIDTLVFKENLNTRISEHIIKDLIETAQVKRLVLIKPVLLSADFDVIFPSLSSILPLVKEIGLSSCDFDDEALAMARVLQNPQPQNIPQMAQPIQQQQQIPHQVFQFFHQFLQRANQPAQQIVQPLPQLNPQPMLQPVPFLNQLMQMNYHQYHQQQPQLMRNLNLIMQQTQNDDQKRAEWRKFKDLLNGTEKVSATFDEDIRPNESTRFSITIIASE